MNPDQLKKASKIFAENAKIGFTPEYFVLGISSGENAHIYSFTPAHVKRLQQYLDHQIKEFEEKHGEITAEWNPNVVSPVQRQNPPSEMS